MTPKLGVENGVGLALKNGGDRAREGRGGGLLTDIGRVDWRRNMTVVLWLASWMSLYDSFYMLYFVFVVVRNQ